MEQQDVGTSPESTPPSLTLVDRFVNIFAAPGEVFEWMRIAPRNHANWLVPLILAFIVSAISVLVIFGQPTLQQQMSDAQHKQFEKQVQAGKITQEQMARTEEMIPKPDSILWKVVGIIFGGAWLVVLFLLATLAVWLIGTSVFKAPLTFFTSLEIVGLSYMVMVLGSIVGTLTIMVFDSLYATPSPAIFIKDYQPDDLIHKLCTYLNFFTIWFVALLGLGLSKRGNVSVINGMIWMFGTYIILILVFATIF